MRRFGYCLHCCVCLALDVDRGRCTVCRQKLERLDR